MDTPTSPVTPNRPQDDEERKERKRGAYATLALAASIASIVVAISGAVFTDTASVDANVFSTGSVDISTSPATAAISLSGMAPGDVVTAPITVTNSGTLQLRYALTSTTTEAALAAQLDMTVKSGVTTCTNAGFGSSGTVLYGPGDLGGTTAIAIFGSTAQGAQAGDRTLNASASETLCIQVSLPLSTGNSYQSLTTTATLAFVAEQTANN